MTGNDRLRDGVVRRLVGVNTKWRRRARTPRACSRALAFVCNVVFFPGGERKGRQGSRVFRVQELRVGLYRVVRKVTDETGDVTTAFIRVTVIVAYRTRTQETINVRGAGAW